jgi:hypothetical protein
MISNSVARTGAAATKALPCALRHWLQWQKVIGPNAPRST